MRSKDPRTLSCRMTPRNAHSGAELIKREAIVCKHCGRDLPTQNAPSVSVGNGQKSKTYLWIFGAIGSPGVLSIIGSIVGPVSKHDTEPSKVSNTPTKQELQEKKKEELAEAHERDRECPAMGEEGFVNRDMPAATSYELISAFVDSAVKHDTMGIEQMYLNKQIFNLARGTKVLVLESTDLGAYKQIRCLSGPHAGEANWIQREFLSRKLEQEAKHKRGKH